MGRSIAVYYTPDDNLEHAVQMIEPAPGTNSGFQIRDVSYSQATLGRVAPAFYTPANTIWAVAGCYCPIDNMRYTVFATDDNKVYWTRVSKDRYVAGNDPLIYENATYRLVGDFPTYPASSIADMAAYFTGTQIEVVVLMNNGDLWRMPGVPFSGTNSWTQIPIWANFKGAKRIALFEGAGWGHIILASDHEVTEVYYTWNQFGSDLLWTFEDTITDVGALFTQEDGVAHIAVSTLSANGTNVQEIFFTPAQVAPAVRLLGTVPFVVESLGMFEEPDKSRHIILQSPPPYADKEILYLCWYYPWWAGFEYTVWPAQSSW